VEYRENRVCIWIKPMAERGGNPCLGWFAAAASRLAESKKSIVAPLESTARSIVQTPLGEQPLHITVKRRYQPTASSMTSGSNCHHLQRPNPKAWEHRTSLSDHTSKVATKDERRAARLIGLWYIPLYEHSIRNRSPSRPSSHFEATDRG
jgi:hypothetical protein